MAMLRLAVALLALVGLAYALAGQTSAGPPACIDPSPNGGGEPPFQGSGTPNHTIVVDGDLCPGATDAWTFATIYVPIEQYVGVRVFARSGEVFAQLVPPFGDPLGLTLGQPFYGGPTQLEQTYQVSVTGLGSTLSSYTLQVCRGIYNPCAFAAVQNPSPGDANCDGQVDVYDAYDVLGFVAGLSPPPGCLQAAQLDSDGRITSRDALLILQRVAGLISGLPLP
jgi:hypothetical protein